MFSYVNDEHAYVINGRFNALIDQPRSYDKTYPNKIVCEKFMYILQKLLRFESQRTSQIWHFNNSMITCLSKISTYRTSLAPIIFINFYTILKFFRKIRVNLGNLCIWIQYHPLISYWNYLRTKHYTFTRVFQKLFDFSKVVRL